MPKNILVIDDDITSLDLVSYLFEDRGYEVHRAGDGLLAIEQAKHLSPALIIVDIMMPGINGIETIKRIRELGLKYTPIIAFTAVDDRVLHDKAVEAGANEVLTKPCASVALINTVKKFLSD